MFLHPGAPRSLREPEGPFKIDLENLAHRSRFEIDRRTHGRVRSCVVHQDVERAQLVDAASHG